MISCDRCGKELSLNELKSRQRQDHPYAPYQVSVGSALGGAEVHACGACLKRLRELIADAVKLWRIKSKE